MDLDVIKRKLHQTAPRLGTLRVCADIGLSYGRVHEVCGTARQSFAAICAGRALSQTQASFIWMTPAWQRAQLHLEGLYAFAPPQRLIHVQPSHRADLLWCAEEALRSGAVPIVVVELDAFPNLTQVRRLHLAAQMGADMGSYRPMGLLLSTDQGGLSGVESRHACEGAHQVGQTQWYVERLRSRSDPVKAWHVHGALNAEGRYSYSAEPAALRGARGGPRGGHDQSFAQKST